VPSGSWASCTGRGALVAALVMAEATALIHLGDTHHAAGDPDAARDPWQQARSILDNLHHPDADQVRSKLAAIHPAAGGLPARP